MIDFEIYIRWAFAGLPIFAINYPLYLIVHKLTKNRHLAYWSWILASPFTYHVWKFIEGL